MYYIPGTRRSKSTPADRLAVHASLHYAIAPPSPGDLRLHFSGAALRAAARPKPYPPLRCTALPLRSVTPLDSPAGRPGPVHRALTPLPVPGPPQPPLSGLSDRRAAGGAASAIPGVFAAPVAPHCRQRTLPPPDGRSGKAEIPRNAPNPLKTAKCGITAIGNPPPAVAECPRSR